MKSGKLLAVIAVGVTVLCGSALAQTNVNEEQGIKPHDALHGGDLDSVSLTSGSLLLHIPLASFPQRGNLDLTFSVFANTKQWTLVPWCDQSTDPCTWKQRWQPLPRGGLLPLWLNPNMQMPLLPVDGAYVASSVDWWLQSICDLEPPDGSGQTLYDWSQRVVAPDGNIHQFGSGIGNCPSFPMRSIDATGLLQKDASTVVMPNGTDFAYPSPNPYAHNSFPPNSVTDANGNQITINSSGAFTDSLGRVIAAPPGVSTSDLSACPAGTTSAKLWTVPGPASGSRSFKFCYSNVSIYTSFNDGADYPATSTSLLSAIVLPDLTMWTFSYDHWGDVTRLGLPTGGSISYTYGMAPFTTGDSTQSLVVTSRTVDANDGTGGYQWQYQYSGTYTSGGYSGTTRVTSPDGNDTVHTIVSAIAGASGSLFDTQVQYYQGSQNGGTLLKTTGTQYSGIANGDGTAANVVPTQTTITWPDGHSSKAVNTWDSGNTSTNGPVVFGSLLQRDEYDFSNTLVRSTVNHYLWQDNAAYKNNNFLGLKTSSTLKNGAGTQVAQTTYTYDQGSVVSSGIGAPTHVAPPAGEPIRGNLTTTSHWLDSTNSFLSSTATYFDTGMLATSTPPANTENLNRTTTYSYSSTFLGAYVTQTNMPDTQMPDAGATVVHHIISGNYDFNTGLLTSFIDENSQTYTYQYDNMLRLTQGNHPDGGQTNFLYPDPNTIERQRLITGTTYDDYKVKFDGLGRAYQTQGATPSGMVLTDTSHDSLGRVSTVSNP